MTRILRAGASGLAASAMLLALAGPASAQIEDYARYQPQSRCNPDAKAGTTALARWLVRRGGGYGPISRRCRSGGTSEHKEGRAFDWMLDASSSRDRAIARELLDLVFATDRQGNEDARARRMGIMYIIWNDHMYPAYNGFEREDYRSSSCRRLRKCSPTLRHRDHMHISLSRLGGQGLTSWYEGRVSLD